MSARVPCATLLGGQDTGGLRLYGTGRAARGSVPVGGLIY